MFFAPRLSDHERRVVSRLRLLGIEAERTLRPRAEFRDNLRDLLLAEARKGCCGGKQSALAGC